MGEFAKLEICEIMGSNRSSGVSSNVSESSLGQQSQEAGFDEKTQQELGVYVYALFSDQEVSPFYIGKGVNNRVFDHLKCALKDEEVKKLKYDKIRGSKKVKHVIVRHGLTEKEAFAVEGALIDILGYIGEAMTNIQGGHNNIEKGLMTSDEIIRIYNAEPLESIPENCVIININGTYKRGHSRDAIYDATKESWVISNEKIPKLQYVLSEYRGLIVEVFEVIEWFECPAVTSQGKGRIRWGFEGKAAEDSFRTQFLNRSIKKFNGKGQANPVRYTLVKTEQ